MYFFMVFFFNSFDNGKKKKRDLASMVTIPDSLTPILGRASGELLNLLLKNNTGPLAQ